jgi:hypothetical protein
MKIPKQSKPVRRAGFMNRLKVNGISNLIPSTFDDESEDITDIEDEGDASDLDDGGEEAGGESYEGNDEVGE